MIRDARAGAHRRGRPSSWLRRVGRGVTLLSLLVAGFAVPGCVHAPKPRPEAVHAVADAIASGEPATPPYFRVDGGPGASLLLLGTIHVGPKEGWQLSSAIEAGLAEANRIALEVDLRLASEEAVSSLVAELVLLGPGQTLPGVVAPETARLLEERDATLTRMGFPNSMRNLMKPWFVAVGVTESIYTESGLSSDAAVEEQVLAALGDRPLIGLETFEEQLRLLDGLSPALQDLMLRDTLARLDDAPESVRELLTAWRTGDEATLARLAREGIDELPELDRVYDQLLGDRNRRWVRSLRPLLEDPTQQDETILVAVGAMHLVGRDSLVELFRREGFRVEAVPQGAKRAHALPPTAHAVLGGEPVSR